MPNKAKINKLDEIDKGNRFVFFDKFNKIIRQVTIVLTIIYIISFFVINFVIVDKKNNPTEEKAFYKLVFICSSVLILMLCLYCVITLIMKYKV
jgi:amino acid transporter